MPGNPKIPENRTYNVQVLLNVTERKALEKAADRNAMASLAGYIRSRALLAARHEEETEQEREQARARERRRLELTEA
jgi:hypothetical protein